MIKIVNDKNLIFDVWKYDVILVPMSINNSMNKGFKYEIGINFPYVKEEEQKTPYGDNRKYGMVKTVRTDGLIFCLCYMYVTPCAKKHKKDFVKYDSLEQCLKNVVKLYSGKKIASPIMGSDVYDGSGDKDNILAIYEKICGKIDITLYDYIQRDYRKDIFIEIAVLHKKLKEKEVSLDEFIKIRIEIELRRRYGIFKKMPENYKYVPRRGEFFVID